MYSSSNCCIRTLYVARIHHIIYLYTKTSLAFRQFPAAHRIRLLLVSLSLSLFLFSFCFFCLIVRSFVAAAVVAVVCDEKPVHKIDDDDDSDGSDGDDDYNGWFFEDMNRVKS